MTAQGIAQQATDVLYWSSPERHELMTITLVSTQKCGFCNDKNHARCAVGVKHAGRHDKYPQGVVWTCTCEEGGCTTGRRKCAYCNNRNTEEVDPGTWECFDIEACRATVQAKRESDPLYHQLNEIQRRAEMAKIENAAEKTAKRAESKPKTGTCVCGCAGTTKGGKFLPGHDARFVSVLVSGVADAKFTKKADDAARKRLKEVGASDALQGKYTKQVGIAEAKVTKAAEAAKAKADAKAEKASA